MKEANARLPRIAGKLSKFTQAEIILAFERARCLHKTTGLTLLRAPRQADYARILIVTPRAAGSAPERNKLRRQLKALFYEHGLYHGVFDYIAIFKKGAAQLSFETLKKILTTS